MIDLGFLMGLLGLVTGIVAILYARTQAAAARIQAQEAAHMSTLLSSSELLQRYREIRRRILSFPAIRQEFLRNAASRPPLSELVDLWRSEDGLDHYTVYRDAMDTAQDAYFLRQRGIMSDEHWYVWTKTHMSIWAQFPGFERTFQVASRIGLIHPDFAKFYEPVFRGGSLGDPANSTQP